MSVIADYNSYGIPRYSVCCSRYGDKGASLAIHNRSDGGLRLESGERTRDNWRLAGVDKWQVSICGWNAPSSIGLLSHYCIALRAIDVRPASSPRTPLPGVFRRFVAFFLDFILAMVLIGAIVGFLPTLAEWKRTGTFQWQFERTLYAPSDGWLTAAEAILLIPGLVFYFVFPLTRLRPSPGACIAGYQIVPDDGIAISVRTAILRTLLGFIALCAAYLAPFVARDRKKGKFWLDAVFGTRALMLK